MRINPIINKNIRSIKIVRGNSWFSQISSDNTNARSMFYLSYQVNNLSFRVILKKRLK